MKQMDRDQLLFVLIKDVPFVSSVKKFELKPARLLATQSILRSVCRSTYDFQDVQLGVYSNFEHMRMAARAARLFIISDEFQKFDIEMLVFVRMELWPFASWKRFVEGERLSEILGIGMLDEQLLRSRRY